MNSRILVTLILGFSSGLPLALTGSTLQAWFTQADVDLITIGALSFVGVPYVWKFLWAPMMDRFVPPWLGRRRGWILLTQLGLCLGLFVLANTQPHHSPKLIGLLALIIAFFSASQDVVVDAYRTDILRPEERGLGSACYIFAYRMAMLISGGLGLILAEHLGWQTLYQLMAGLIALSSIAAFFGPEQKNITPPVSLVDAFYGPFVNLLQRNGIGIILLFVIFYKLGDAFALALMSNFLLKGLGFSLTDIGIAFKSVGLFATLAGAFAGGLFLTRIDLFKALLVFGIAQAFSNLMFMLLAYAGKNYWLMTTALFIENFCSGMGTAAFMAFLMSLCHPRFSAAQYALLSALSAVGRVSLGPAAALLVKHSGWINFYFWSFFLCFPGILLINLLRNRVRLDAQVAES